jgi:hypothetical protein
MRQEEEVRLLRDVWQVLSLLAFYLCTSSTNSDTCGAVCGRCGCSLYFLYQYSSTNADRPGGLRVAGAEGRGDGQGARATAAQHAD